MPDLDEFEIRQWMKTAPLETVRDLVAAGRVIVEMREELAPKRKRRSDAGKPRKPDGQQELIP